VTTVLPDDPPERACEADGIAMPHSEVQVVDEADLWKSRQAVADAWRRFKEGHTSSFRNREYLIMETLHVQYQKTGPRQRPSAACVDPAIVPDPQTWLTERLGPLAFQRDA
jgi:putative DNA primase/helicase